MKSMIQKLSCSNVVITVILIVTQWQGASSVNTLESTPPAVNGMLTVCAGEQISLTCNHDHVVTGSTRWIASPPVSCVTDVSHIGTYPPPPCGPFMFQQITLFYFVPTHFLNSTVVATATIDMNGTIIECIGGNVLNSFSVGNVSVYVADLDPVSASIFYNFLPNNLTSVVLEWDSNSSLSQMIDSYTITIDGVDIPPDRISVLSSTRYVVSGLEANRMYTAFVNRSVHSEPNCMSELSNVTFEIRAENVIITTVPISIVETRFFCANSSDLTTVALSWMFPSGAPPGIVYPPPNELSVTVSISNTNVLVSDITFSASQSYAFLHLRNDANYTISVEASHDITGLRTNQTVQLATSVYTVDTSTTLQDNQVTVKLNERCIENPTSFMTTLSYGSCPNSLQYMTSQAFNSSGVASLKLDDVIEDVIGNMCIQVKTTHQAQPNTVLSTFEQELMLNSCSVASIKSDVRSSVTVEFSLAETSGEVPHGTTASLMSRLFADQLVGAACYNGLWSDLSPRASSLTSSLSTSEAVAITFVLSTISALIVGAITSSLITYCIMKRQTSKHLATDQSKGALYEEVSQPKTSDKVFEMGENIAYGPVRR